MIFQKVLPPFWLLLAAFFMWVFDHWLPVKELFPRAVGYGGVGLICIAVANDLFCAYLFRRHQTTIFPFKDSSNLIQSGTFRISRNPIYLSMVLILIGWWLWLGSLTPLVVIPFFVVFIQEQFIKPEEAMLTEKFGKEYQDYSVAVRRWL